MKTRQSVQLRGYHYLLAILVSVFALNFFPAAIAQPTASSKPGGDAAGQARAQTVRATCFELINAKGEVTARLWNGETGVDPHIVFYGDSQSLRVRVEERTKYPTRPANPQNRIQAPKQTARPQIRILDIEDHTIIEVLGRGKFIRLDNGTTWEVESGNESTVESWGNVEVVLKTIEVNGILLYEIIDSEDHESVDVMPVR